LFGRLEGLSKYEQNNWRFLADQASSGSFSVWRGLGEGRKFLPWIGSALRIWGIGESGFHDGVFVTIPNREPGIWNSEFLLAWG
jgi:hypothetical protein